MRVKLFAGAVFGAAVLSVAVAALAQTASKGVYSKAQAERGAALYANTCARCHGPSMEGLDVAPPLTGGLFLGNWSGQPVAALAERIRTTMPLDQPGTLGLTASAEITAALLAANGYPAGAADMPTGAAALQALMIDAPPGK
jgi:mono/diheme cytochrome c family protein